MITEKELGNYLRVKNPEADPDIGLVVLSTNAFVDSLPDKPTLIVEGEPEWAPQTKLAALMFGARLYQRRNSPNGIEALQEGGATYVARYDPDVARLLRLDGHQIPRVG